jgi:hypothetical protein
MDSIQKVLVNAGRKDLAQKYYLKIAKEFPSEKALNDYLRDHPKSDKSKHTVKKLHSNPSWSRYNQ